MKMSQQLLEYMAANPDTTCREAAEHLGRSIDDVRGVARYHGIKFAPAVAGRSNKHVLPEKRKDYVVGLCLNNAQLAWLKDRQARNGGTISQNVADLIDAARQNG